MIQMDKRPENDCHRKVAPVIPMPIKAKPYEHQIEAFNFACRLFGLAEGGDDDISINRVTNSVALLMEM